MLQSFSQNYQNFDLSFGVWKIKMYMYTETSKKKKKIKDTLKEDKPPNKRTS